MMATRVVGGFDEEETCAAMRTHVMRLCTARAMLAAAGGGKRGGLPGTCSIFILKTFIKSVLSSWLSVVSFYPRYHLLKWSPAARIRYTD